MAAPITSTDEPITITPTPEPTVAPMTEEQFKEQSTTWFTTMAKGSGFREQDLRYLIESSLLLQQGDGGDQSRGAHNG